MTDHAHAHRASGRFRWLLGAVALTLLVIAIVVWGIGGGRAKAGASGPPLGSAAVVRTNLTATVPASGALAYQRSVFLTSLRSGTAYTRLPEPGDVIRRGEQFAAVDDQPIFLFYGRVPEWRALGEGVSDGPDVTQLNGNLLALGFATSAEIGSDRDAYAWGTAVAVERWQIATGMPVTGTVALGTIAFAPGPLRVAAVDARLGSTPQPGATLIEGGPPTPLVDVPLPVGEQSLLRVGQAVTVTLPNGHTTASGAVATIAPVATSASSSQSGQPTVAVTIRLVRPPHLRGALDQAPVTVNIVTGTARGALAVPVSALVALSGGGYAVDLDGPGGARLVAVRTGLFAGGVVQVSGALSTSDRVEVPAS